MNQLIKKLTTLTIILFAASLLLHLNDSQVSNDLASGSDFIKGFNPAQANKIIIKKENSEALTLRRLNQSYVMSEHYNYPAENDKINVLLFKIADIKVLELISKSKGDFEKYNLTDDKSKIEVQVYNNQEELMLNFLIGKDKNNKGQYIRFKDKKDIYLTDSLLSFSTDMDSYIKKTINIQESKNIQNVNASLNGNNIEIVKKDNNYKLTKKNKSIKDDEVKDYVSKLGSVTFQNVKPRNSAESASLNFDQQLSIIDKNKIITSIEIASHSKKYFVRLSSSIKDAPKEVSLGKNDSDEKLKNIDEMIKAQQKSQEFNLKHSGWVYEVSENTFNNLTIIK
jgi:hypothetical protein